MFFYRWDSIVAIYRKFYKPCSTESQDFSGWFTSVSIKRVVYVFKIFICSRDYSKPVYWLLSIVGSGFPIFSGKFTRSDHVVSPLQTTAIPPDPIEEFIKHLS